MGKVKQGTWTAQLEGDFVVFIIGTRPDPLHPVRWFNDVGGMRGMLHMLKYLSEHPEKGMAVDPIGFGHIVTSTGVPSSTSSVSPQTRTTRTHRLGASTGSGWADQSAPASGTRPSSSAQASTKRSTQTCPRTASESSQTWSPRQAPPPEAASSEQRRVAPARPRGKKRPCAEPGPQPPVVEQRAKRAVRRDQGPYADGRRNHRWSSSERSERSDETKGRGAPQQPRGMWFRDAR